MAGGKFAELRRMAQVRRGGNNDATPPQGIPLPTRHSAELPESNRVTVAAAGADVLPPSPPPPPPPPRRPHPGQEGSSQASKKRKEAPEPRSSQGPEARANPETFSMGDFTRSRMDELQLNPIRSAVNIFRYYGDLHDTEIEAAQVRARGAIREWDLACRERDEPIKKLEPTSRQLTRVRNELSELKKKERRLEEANGALTSEAASLKEATEQVPSLRARVEELEKALDAKKEERKAVKASLEAAKEGFTKTLEDTCTLLEETFESALKQVEVVFPAFQRVPDVFNPKHEMEDEKIVRKDPETGVTAVIFPQP